MEQTGRFLIYGATGFTGKLTARIAKERGLKPTLAGRNKAKLMAVADPLGFQCCAFDLSDAHAIDAALAEVDVVLHIAGPFSATSKPMADACLRTGTHYLDITGEIDVLGRRHLTVHHAVLADKDDQPWLLCERGPAGCRQDQKEGGRQARPPPNSPSQFSRHRHAGIPVATMSLVGFRIALTPRLFVSSSYLPSCRARRAVPWQA
jgi:Saccharopine dehydrogenase NADP binding domain